MGQNGTEKSSNGHGGARPGAGRKPKAIKYASEIAQAEEKIIAALPDLIEQLIQNANTGDTQAAKYLLDRVFGRVKEQTAPLAEDTALPLEEEDLQVIEEQTAAKRKQAREWAALGMV